MDKKPIVTMKLNNGDQIKLELYPEIAPNTVNNFVSLINSKYYNGLKFHRVIKNFMIQGGCPQGTGVGGPGYAIKGEFSGNSFTNDLKHDRGVISMARAGDPDSAGSQFFIMHKDSPHLDSQYAGFGKVIEGIEIVDNIANCKTSFNDKPSKDIVIEDMTVETYGVSYPEPDKI
ncbi:peptidylprolyl isomerase [Alkalibaculum sp. M08DMB]|uniref:Peptidyl-prolyl cis-trans isomerase n=1 Tax=Alkalibaculum sporogenes TaxID=2655001 RepID=A0A6A7KBK2_9FIRM|nr:peptidylprolyl isomerase [Alkalibaculum sporogenes]MPW26567.1 peptidylprolyl isomerase [Alkalibaculum sporogenes]